MAPASTRSASRHLVLLYRAQTGWTEITMPALWPDQGRLFPTAEASLERLRARQPQDQPEPSTNLDPSDWAGLREQGHRMLDDMLDHLQTIRERPLWQAPSAAARASFRAALPHEPSDLAAVYASFREHVLPYGSGCMPTAAVAHLAGRPRRHPRGHRQPSYRRDRHRRPAQRRPDLWFAGG